MRYKIRFYTENDMNISIHYNIELAKAVRNLLNPKYREFVDKGGFSLGKAIYKPYTFSRLFPQEYRVTNSKLEIKKGYVDLIVSSIDENFWFSFLEGLLKEKKITLYGNTMYLDSFAIKKFKRKNKMIVKTLSPIMCRINLSEQTKNEFELFLKGNVVNKACIFKKRIFSLDDINLKFFENTVKETIVMLNGTPNKAYSGLILLDGDEDIVEVAYFTGIGPKNALGFGCVEDIKLKNERVIYKLSL